MKWLVVVVLAACSVSPVALEGKGCPCVTGYRCGVDMRCHAMIDANKDTGSGGSCLGSAPGAAIAHDALSAFTPSGGTWTPSGSELKQTNAASGLVFAYSTNPADDLPSYRVVATMTGMAPGTSMGISVHIAGGQKARYDCLWSLGSTGTLFWQTVNNGNNPTTILPTAMAPSVDTITMEVLANGTTLTCCIDANGATVMATNANNPGSGFPGVVVNNMVATFSSFDLYMN